MSFITAVIEYYCVMLIVLEKTMKRRVLSLPDRKDRKDSKGQGLSGVSTDKVLCLSYRGSYLSEKKVKEEIKIKVGLVICFCIQRRQSHLQKITRTCASSEGSGDF